MVGRIIMKAAADQLIPVTLELGGKSPCFIDISVNLKIAAKRIVFGKFINCGQSCIAPDYVLIPSKLKEEFIGYLREFIEEFYTKEPKQSSEYSRIINSKHFDRLQLILEKEKENIIVGGSCEKKDLFIEPTILDNIKFDSYVMNEEIFGPILPIIEYENGIELLNELRLKEKPLAFYIFSNRQSMIQHVEKIISCGSMCVNDTISQYTKLELPFGGIGQSGIGKYHGKSSFDTFSHEKSVLENSPNFDPSMKYPPFDENKTKWIERFDFSFPYQTLLVFSIPLMFYGISKYWKKEE
jgi:aldehyde dehydrogenase (NAD+)